jgi:aryl-alcohol dehydrogenase-like predicted oxidoreductase
MEQRYVGASGLRVSRLGLGTMTWGRDTDEHESREQLTAFLDAGGTFLDTAAGYGDGAAEEIIGDLLAGHARREDVVICTKAGISRRTGDRVVDTSRRALLDSLDGSLDRLQTDHVDLWLAHTWSDGVPLEETLSALDAAVDSGRARYVGISNYAGWQTARAATWQQLRGRTPLVATQVEYSLANRDVEDEVLPSARAHGMGVLAWSPLGRGVLTGKYRHGTPADSRGASPHFAAFVDRFLDPESRRIVDALVTAAEGLDCSPAELALAWVRDQPGVAAPIVGARTAAQLRGTLRSEEVDIPAPIRAALDEISGGPVPLVPQRVAPSSS